MHITVLLDMGKNCNTFTSLGSQLKARKKYGSCLDWCTDRINGNIAKGIKCYVPKNFCKIKKSQTPFIYP